MTLTVNQGVPLVIEKRDHPSSKAIFQLASMLSNSRASTPAGKSQSNEAAPVAKEEKGRGGLFGRLRGSK